MTRYQQCDRIGCTSVPDSSNRSRVSDRTCDLAVCTTLSIRNSAQLLPYSTLKCGSPNVQRQIDGQATTIQMVQNLRNNCLKLGVALLYFSARKLGLKILF